MAQEIADSKLLDTWGSSGTKIEPDISKIIEGWQLGEQPPHEYMNWLQNTFGSKLNHILKNGVAEWNNETEYLAGSSVKHSGNVWLCKTTNTNSEPTELNANWERLAINKDLTVTVDTLADLKNISYPAYTVWASGYHAKNDGAFGSHIFRLKGVKTTETDNGGTVIIATIGGTDYVYELQYDGAVNVKWFGAVASNNYVDNDATIVIQSIVDAGFCCIDLNNESFLISTVLLNQNKKYNITNGKVYVTENGFKRIKTDTPQVSSVFAEYNTSFDNVNFEKNTANGSCIAVSIAWQDSTAGIVVSSSCEFKLSNGATGIRLSASFGNTIGGNYYMDDTSKAIVCDSKLSIDSTSFHSPIDSIVDSAFFHGGIAFDQEFTKTSPYNSFEGFTFSACKMYGSKFKATKFNGLMLANCALISSDAIIDSGFNTSINGGYFDKLSTAQTVLTIKTTLRDTLGFTIDGGAMFSTQGYGGDIIRLSDIDRAGTAQISNFTVGCAYFVAGGTEGPATARGITFDHASVLFANISPSASFQNMYSAMNFVQGVSQSKIREGIFRDCIPLEGIFPDTNFYKSAAYKNVGSNSSEVLINTSITNGSLGVGNANTLGKNTGSQNIAVGINAMLENLDGSDNSAFGTNAMISNKTGSRNISVGINSAFTNTSGNNNVSVGANSMYLNSTGSGNTAIGYQANFYGTNSYCTGVGYNALNSVVNYTNATGLGNDAQVTGSNQVQLGNSATTTYAYGAVVDRSDARDKADIIDNPLGLDFINKIKPVQFKWDFREDYFNEVIDENGLVTKEYYEKDGSKVRNRYHNGVIAQQVKEVMDELDIDFAGYKDSSIDGGADVLSIGYEEFISPIIKAIQELSAKVSSLESVKA